MTTIHYKQIAPIEKMGTNEKKDYSAAVFGYYYQRARQRCGELYLFKEDDHFNVFRLAMTYYWASWAAHRLVKGEKGYDYRHTPDVTLLMDCIKEYVFKEYGEHDVSRTFVMSLQWLQNEMDELIKAFDYNGDYRLRLQALTIATGFVKCYLPKDYLADKKVNDLLDDYEYIKFIESKTDFNTNSRYEMTYWAVGQEMIGITKSVFSQVWGNPQLESEKLYILQNTFEK